MHMCTTYPSHPLSYTGKCCEEGKSFLSEVPDSPAAKAYMDIISSEQHSLSSLLPQGSHVTILPLVGVVAACEMSSQSLSTDGDTEK